ncbi:LytR/AlgR family response regulator transcription factor [Dyadobacter pollutisoli]|uniref:LytTR family DNA-binding domain-containing protein n=1 Tax=Dyadobacter pollutisoli TaxID=2910158 RepID=A0A9E8NDH2_9BACT|nr:LytTR family DNA-binding domain-containing protein [Dyadobacter pollutisoli]WAC14675.1 LytTR family DNA-binding domain-containing protein [Dyadobacter pollutisoli]
MNCLIIDDNVVARGAMKQLVRQDKDLVLLGECENAVEAYQKIMAEPVDLLLLDIEMDGMTGIELAKSLGTKNPIIIFVTGHRDYAIEAFELNVADYMTKPVTPVRFLQAIEKAKDIYKSKTQEVKLDDESFVFIRDSNVVRRIKIDDILFAEAMGDYVRIYTADHSYSIHSSLRQVESKLPVARFLRVHRSFIIQVGKIDTIEGGTLIINRKTVPVADAYRAALNKRLNIL